MLIEYIKIGQEQGARVGIEMVLEIWVVFNGWIWIYGKGLALIKAQFEFIIEIEKKVGMNLSFYFF